MRVSLLLLCLVMVASPLAGIAQSQANQSIQDVTFCQLMKDPSAYAGIQIRVRAIFRFVLEESDLEQPECCPDNIFRKMRVAGPSGNPEYPDKFTKKTDRLAKRLYKGMSGVALVDLVGRIDRGVFSVDRIERIERLSRSSDLDHEPSWVPRDCASRVSEMPHKKKS
jgi:hypothetical protein